MTYARLYSFFGWSEKDSITVMKKIQPEYNFERFKNNYDETESTAKQYIKKQKRNTDLPNLFQFELISVIDPEYTDTSIIKEYTEMFVYLGKYKKISVTMLNYSSHICFGAEELYACFDLWNQIKKLYPDLPEPSIHTYCNLKPDKQKPILESEKQESIPQSTEPILVKKQK